MYIIDVPRGTGDKTMDRQFELKGWVAIYRRYQSYGLYKSVDDAISAGVQQFKNNGASFDVFEGSNKMASVRYQRGVVTSRIPEWIPTIFRF
jgi:hypothetical protein